MMTLASIHTRKQSNSLGIILMLMTLMVVSCVGRAEDSKVSMKVSDGKNWKFEVEIKNTNPNTVSIQVIYPLNGKGLPVITPGEVVFEQFVNGHWVPIVIYHDVVGTGEKITIPEGASKRGVISVAWLKGRVEFPSTVRGKLIEHGTRKAVFTNRFIVLKDGNISAMKE